MLLSYEPRAARADLQQSCRVSAWVRIIAHRRATDHEHGTLQTNPYRGGSGV